jgi:aryl-alcohol dehydrogenase-like predicted oxidoreductase
LWAAPNTAKERKMKKIRLFQSNFESSRLGFGCVQLTAHDTRKEALAVLEHAFAQGIMHFDVARAYGFGRAEGILRDFLRHKRRAVTVTTKFGIEPPSGLASNASLINGLKKILRPFPGLLRKVKNRGSAMVIAGAFSPEAAVQSLETSLRELGTDYVDIFLLHEGTVADAGSASLQEALIREVEKGKIRHLGLGSDFRKLQGVETNGLPASYEVLQFNDNVIDRNARQLSDSARFLITHSIFVPPKTLRAAVHEHPQIARKFSNRINVDLADPSVLTTLLLRFALWNNANGIVLFSSKDIHHIDANIRQADLEPFDNAEMRQFLALVDQLSAMQISAPHAGAGTGRLNGTA